MISFLSLFLFGLLGLFSGCGYDKETTVIEYQTPEQTEDEAYTWDDMKGFCFTCHNSTAPKIPLDEKDFVNSAKVRNKINDGSMPPNKNGFDKTKALKYLESSSYRAK